jgi:hypothetical protein
MESSSEKAAVQERGHFALSPSNLHGSQDRNPSFPRVVQEGFRLRLKTDYW